jgi:hypothetical protein
VTLRDVRTGKCPKNFICIGGRFALSRVKETPSMFRCSFLSVAAAVLLSAAPALAHHAFSADFDRDKPVTLDGAITKVEWTNPHAYVYLDVKDTSGHTANWKVELGSRDELAGWTTRR